jgi:hypothetical protein
VQGRDQGGTGRSEEGKKRHLLIVAHSGGALGGVFEQGSDLVEGGSGVREGRRAGVWFEGV